MAKATILLIQSIETQGNGTKRHLEDRGYQVIWAGSGLTALMLARKKPIDLILLDVALPDIEGLDLCRRFRVQQDTHSIPIILLAAHGYTPESGAGKACGPDDYLAKPFSESELEVRIAAVLHAGAAAETPSTAELQPVPAQKQEPVALPAAQPALITVMQQAATPEPKLAENAERGPLPQPETRPEETPGPERAGRKPVLRVVPPLNPKPVQKTEPASAPTAVPRGDMAAPAPLPPFQGEGGAVIDPATGLFGRPQFEAMFSKEFKRALRFKQQMSCMLISLDGRKMERAEDEALIRAIIGLVQRTIREVDTAAWWTGKEFIVLLPNTTRNDAVQAAARILEAVANHPFTWPDSTKVTMSIGVAGLPDENIGTEQKLIEAADAACRRAGDLMLPSPQHYCPPRP
jgi:diguanylate cyclase (GGDEF)-like protein